MVAFFAERLVHTKGPWAREAFVLRDWQEDEVIRPLFGEVVWSPEWGRYVRRFRVVVLVLPRKNGKSEMLAGIVLYLLVGDDEYAAELYGAAKDTKQAGKVFEPAWQMAKLSPRLSRRLKLNKHARRIVDESTSSYYEIITSDALGELGHNPHGFVLDEALSQADDGLWNAMRTAAGTRTQPMQLLATTETADEHSFGAQMIDEAVRVDEDPARAPHWFTYVKRTATDAEMGERFGTEFDPFDESWWHEINPALGEFLSVEVLRQEAMEARNDPTKEASFRQFRLNQRGQETAKWLHMTDWDASGGAIMFPRPDHLEKRLATRPCGGGLDLSSKEDLTALCWVFPDEPEGPVALWRCFVPAARISHLDKHTAGAASVWVDQGWLVATPGNVIDYEAIYAQIDEDVARFTVLGIASDPWLLEPVRQEICARTGLEAITPVRQTFAGMSEATKQTKTLILREERSLVHGGNPVARWCASNVAVRQDDVENVRPVKPDRMKTGKRIDAFVALALAVEAAIIRRGEEEEATVIRATSVNT